MPENKSVFFFLFSPSINVDLLEIRAFNNCPYLRLPMLLYLKVKPNQRFDKVEKIGNDWQIRLKAPAIDGQANEHLVEYLSKVLGVSKSKILLKKGHTAKIKCLDIDLNGEMVTRKLMEAELTN